MISAKQVASYMITRANSLGNGDRELSGNNNLTNLKLQKMLYFFQVEHLKRFDQPLFREEIQAWHFGPVVKEVYEWLCGCGAYVITEFDITPEDISSIPRKIITFLDDMWDKYNKFSAWGLVEKTHEPESVWSKVYDAGRGERQAIEIELLKTAATL